MNRQRRLREERGERQNDPQHGFPKSVYAVVTYARRKPSCARLV